MSASIQSHTQDGHMWMPSIEYQVRVSRLREMLTSAAIEAAVVTSAPNFHYFTGVHSPSFLSNARPQICVIPAMGDPVLVVSRSQAPNAKACTWIDQINHFEGFESEALTTLTRTLTSMGLAGESIGFELGSEHRLGMTVNGFWRLNEHLSEADFVDITPQIWALRTIKSDREVSELRKAAHATATAMESAIDQIRPGSTETTVKRDFATTLVALGLDPGYLAIHSGPGSYNRVNSDPTPRRLQKGDLLWMDGGGISKGYRADITRLVSIGKPSSNAGPTYHQVYRFTSSLISAVTPGMTASDLMAACRAIFEEEVQAIGSATRIGHGVGLELTEPPSILDDDTTPLEPGMCLALEPGIATPFGYFVLEEEVLVTESGIERISPPNAEELRSV